MDKESKMSSLLSQKNANESKQPLSSTSHSSLVIKSKSHTTLRSLKRIKDEGDFENELKLIRKEIEQNDVLKNSYIQSGIVNDMVTKLSKFKGSYLIEFYSISLFSELIIDTNGKDFMMKMEIPQVVMDIMKRNAKDHHIQHEACKFFKKIMIKTTYGFQLTTLGLVSIVNEAMETHKSDSKVIIEGYKCLKLLLYSSMNQETVCSLIRIAARIMKTNKSDADLQYEAICDIQKYMQYVNDFNFFMEIKLIRLIFDAVNTHFTYKLFDKGVECLNALLVDINYKTFEQRVEVSKIAIDILNQGTQSTDLNKIFLQSLNSLMNEDRGVSELLDMDISKLLCTILCTEFPEKQRNPNDRLSYCFRYNYYDVSEGIFEVYDAALGYVNHLSKFKNCLENLVQCNILKGVYHLLEESFKSLQSYHYMYGGRPFRLPYSISFTCLEVMVRILESPLKNEVIKDADIIYPLLNMKSKPNIPAFVDLEIAVKISISKGKDEMIRVVEPYIARNPRQHPWTGALMEMKNVARLLDIPKIKKSIAATGAPNVFAQSLQGITSDLERLSVGLWILHQFVDVDGAISDQSYNIIDASAKYMLEHDINHKANFGLIEELTRYYCEDMLRKIPGNDQYLLEYYNKHAIASASIKSAAIVRR